MIDRDEFAKAAMQGILAKYELRELNRLAKGDSLDDPVPPARWVAEQAYLLADAMMEARGRNSKLPPREEVRNA